MTNKEYFGKTVEMMLSDDYKERFRGEYYQLRRRYEKLNNMVANWNHLDFEPTCDYFIYVEQLKAMKEYLDILVERAEMEGVDITEMEG